MPSAAQERVARTVQEVAALPDLVEGHAVDLPAGQDARSRSQRGGPMLVEVDVALVERLDDAALTALVQERHEADRRQGWGW